MTGTVTVRIPKAKLNCAEPNETARAWCAAHGLDTRTMTCRVDGADLVYTGAAVTKGDYSPENQCEISGDDANSQKGSVK